MAVKEIVRIFALEEQADALADAFPEALGLLTSDPECQSVDIYRGVENPSDFVLVATWTSVDAHAAWRASPALAQWRSRLGGFLARPSEMAHFVRIAGN